MAANTCTSSTGVVLGTDPSFQLIHNTRNSRGVTLLVKYTRTAASDLTITLDTLNPSMNSSAMATSAGLAIGSTAEYVSHSKFLYAVGGSVRTKAANAVGLGVGSETVPQNKYGCIAFDINKDGYIASTPAAANATGYNTAALALAGLPAVAEHFLRIGYVTAASSDAGGFIFGTTHFDAVGSTVAYGSTASSAYRVTVLTGADLSDYTLTIAATGNYQIPINLNAAENVLIVNLTVGAAAQGNAIVANISEN